MSKAKPKPKFTDEEIEQIENLAARGLTKYQIAASLGVSRTTLFRRISEDESGTIETAIKLGKQRGVGIIVNALFEKAKGGNLGAMIFFLCNQDPDHWKNQYKEAPVDDTPPPRKIEVVRVDGRKPAANE